MECITFPYHCIGRVLTSKAYQGIISHSNLLYLRRYIVVLLSDSRTIGVGSFKHPISTDMACPTIGTIFSWVGPVTRLEGGEIGFETGWEK